MKLCGRLYEVTQFAPFVRSYLARAFQPDPDSIRPLGKAHIMLRRFDRAASYSRALVESKTDEGGRFELNVPNLQDTSVFLFVSGQDDLSDRVGYDQQSSCRYRSSPFVPEAIDELRQDIYIAPLVLPSESGYSQAALAEALTETKKQNTDIEWIRGTITPNGIVLSCGGKGAKASGRLVLKPDLSGDLSQILRHSVEDFHLELPGPTWLVGLVVSRDAIEASIRAGLRDLASEISQQLRLNAISLFTDLAPSTDSDAANRLAGEISISVNRLHYTTTSGGGSSKAPCTITIEACFGFPRTCERGDSRM